MPHPSLSEPLVLPTPLSPQRTMDPYVHCWCGSGKKWKWCHKNRDKKPPVNYSDAVARLHTEFTKGYCSYPDINRSSCSGRIIRAHTVQRRGGLAAIAEDGHVISVKSAAQDLHKNHGIFIPRKVGVRSASTFFGFCNRHDTQLFRPAETGSATLSEEVCFLLAFRAISYELFNKQAQFRLVDALRDTDAGRPFEEQCQIQLAIQDHQEGIRRGVADTQRWKNQYDRIFLERRFDEHAFVGIELSEVLPVVGCGAFMPEFDFAGAPLQRISHGTAPHEHVTFNISVLNGRSVAVFGATERTGGPAAQFLRSFTNVRDDETADAVVRCAFEFIENTFFRPSWWNSLGQEAKDALIARMRSGLGWSGSEHETGCLQPDGYRYGPGLDVINRVASGSLNPGK